MELARRSPVPVEVHVSAEQLPRVLEAAAFFVCSEALANVAKYARASHAMVRVTAENGCLVVEIRDDGSGGAELSAGSGLRGLADRAEAFGGQLRVSSPHGGGTLVVAEIPLA
jgi:signal transduction histidine kinase